MTVELASLLGGASLPGANGDWTRPLPAETARRLACDATVTRVLVTRHHRDGDGGGAESDPDDLTTRLHAAIALLLPALGGPATQPLEVGRATRVVSAAQRTALTVRDGGCVVPGCDRPPGWCEAHHRRHWLHGGPTDLENQCCCAAPTTAPSTRVASPCTDDDTPPPDAAGRGRLRLDDHDLRCSHPHGGVLLRSRTAAA